MRPKNVDQYIAHAPQAIQPKLKQLRKIIKQVAPRAVEKISYGMPYYGYKGRLVYFRYNKNHLGLYMAPPVIKEHAQELKKYQTSVGTVQFPFTEKLPVPLIKALIKARVKKNDELAKKK